MYRIVLIFLIAVFLRMPLFKTVYWRTPDAMEYISIARNIARGRGFIQTIKYHFWDNHPVVTSALNSRPVFAPVVFAAILKAGADFYGLQLFCIFINALDCVLIYILAKRYLSLSQAMAVGFLAALNPNMLINSRLILSESLSILIVLAFLLSKSGLVLGLAYLTRIENIFLIFFSRNKKLFLGFFLVTIPFFIANYLISGNPFNTYNTIHYQVRDFSFGFTNFNPVKDPYFLIHNFWWVITKVLYNIVSFLKNLAGFGYFGPLIVLLVFSLRKFREYKMFFLFSLLVFLLYASMWSAIFEPARHFLLIYLLLLIPIVSISTTKFSKLIITVTLCGYFMFDIHRIVWARTVDIQPDYWSSQTQLYSWIKSHVDENSIIATTGPQPVNLYTDRPTVMLPENLTNVNYCDYIKANKIEYILKDTQTIYKVSSCEK